MTSGILILTQASLALQHSIMGEGRTDVSSLCGQESRHHPKYLRAGQ